MKSADLVVMVFDATGPWSPENENLVREHHGALIVHNKSDLLTDNRTANRGTGDRPEGLLASAKTGLNLPALCEQISRRLVPRVPPAGLSIPFTAEQTGAIRHALAYAEAGQGHEAATILSRLVATEHPL
jgi:tRNA U34 5-carboxymethylaminomethyl modifying GTPase MnmE/TrmE